MQEGVRRRLCWPGDEALVRGPRVGAVGGEEGAEVRERERGRRPWV